jgi:hypothetical protein
VGRVGVQFVRVRFNVVCGPHYRRTGNWLYISHSRGRVRVCDGRIVTLGVVNRAWIAVVLLWFVLNIITRTIETRPEQGRL